MAHGTIMHNTPRPQRACLSEEMNCGPIRVSRRVIRACVSGTRTRQGRLHLPIDVTMSTMLHGQNGAGYRIG